MKIGILKTPHEEWVRVHIDSLFSLLRDKNVEIEEFTLDPQNPQRLVDELVAFKPFFTIDVNAKAALVAETEKDKKLFSDIFGFVHVSLFVDDPLMYFPSLLQIRGAKNFLPVVFDLKYADSLRFLGFQNVSYIVPFIDPAYFGGTLKVEKDTNLLFVGPIVDPSRIEEDLQKAVDPVTFAFFRETGHFMFRNPEVNVLTAIDYMLPFFNPDFQSKFIEWKEKNPQDFLKLLNDITIYASSLKRWFLIGFLEGMDLTVVGEFVGEPKENHHVVKPDNHVDLIKLYASSYLCILSIPYNVPSGVGFTTLEVGASGSVPMVDYRASIQGMFIPDREVITYLPLDRADIEEKILYFLDHPTELRDMGEICRKKVISGFSPDTRADFLYNLFESIIKNSTSSQRTMKSGAGEGAEGTKEDKENP